jgi:putative ABC transport system substrate-binding protein
MKRREFMMLLGGAAAWPPGARAQQVERMRQLGVLSSYAEDYPEAKERFAIFEQELKRLGWSQGRNLHIDYRFAHGSAERMQALAKELVSQKPDVMFTTSTLTTAALQRETRVIPIVFVAVSDPIGSGFIASLARPGGNLTGLLNFEASITGKWLAMLKEIAPGLMRVAFVARPNTTPYDYFLRAAETAAATLELELVPSPVENGADIDRVITSFARVPGGGLLLPPDVTTHSHRDLVLALAARHRLPAVFAFRHLAAAGGLMSYGPALADLFRQAASYVDRILRGDRPADLPVRTPIKYETVINLKTAKVLGLTVPPILLARADEVIE